MKFGENLKLNLTHEWRKQYIDYEKLKGKLKLYQRYRQWDIEKRLVNFQNKIFFKTYSDIIERYEGVAHVRNFENSTSVVSRKSSPIGEVQCQLKKRKSVLKSVGKSLQMEFILNQMTDRGVQKMFDQCSQEFFIAVEEELGLKLFVWEIYFIVHHLSTQ